jgi:S1-C subfamily serine protease
VRTPRQVSFALLLGGVVAVRVLPAQDSTRCAQDTMTRKNVPLYAQALVVGLQSYFGDATTPFLGAGIIVGTDARGLLIVTAAHVVRKRPEGTPARAIWVCFASQGSRRAATLASLDTVRRKGFDVAVIRVAGDARSLERWIPPSWDRQGHLTEVARDDPVNPVGCPNDRCWQTPTPADRVSFAGKIEIEFQSAFVDEGSSGGALFNRSWEVIGMLVGEEPPHGRAIRIDQIVAQLDTWRIPLRLEKASYPRGGYRTSIGFAVMNPTQGSSAVGHAPSGRLTVVRQVSPWMSWHLGGLRLAPENLVISAGMGGVGVQVRKGRFVLRPFAEAGFGRMEGRYDLGGYYVGSQYVPFWHRVTDDGLGIGGGATLEVITLPRTILELTGGFWSFTPPENTPRLQTGFVGAGLRWGL